MRIAKRFIIVLGSIVIVLLLLNYGISHYIENNLTNIINKQKNVPYNITYNDIDISLLSGSISLNEVYLAPKDSAEATQKLGLAAKIKTVKVSNFNIWQLLKNDKIKVRRVLLDTPDVILYETDNKKINDRLSEPFKQTITTGSIGIVNGSIRLFDEKERLKGRATGISTEIDNITVDSTTTRQNIPIEYSRYMFKCDSLFYDAGRHYTITADHVNNTESSLTINNLKLVPKYSRAAFTKAINLEKDLFSISVTQFKTASAKWGYHNDILYVHAPEATLQNLNMNVYRNKIPKDDPSVKKLLSAILRDQDFDLKLEKVLVKNSNIIYEEQVDFTRPAAKVSFTNLYATVHNLYTGVNNRKTPLTAIDIQCTFMHATPLKANWTFNVSNKSDAFTFKGSMGTIRTERLNTVMKPLVNVTTSGVINELQFDYKGNIEKATGTFAIKYDDFKINVFSEDGKDKKGLVSALGNLLINNDSDDNGFKKVNIDVNRAKDKSFFNFIWLCTQDGLRKAVLPKIVEKALPDVKPMKRDKKKD